MFGFNLDNINKIRLEESQFNSSIIYRVNQHIGKEAILKRRSKSRYAIVGLLQNDISGNFAGTFPLIYYEVLFKKIFQKLNLSLG